MLSSAHVNQWVRDQDEALAFYTEKLGMELRDDVTVPEMGNFRWLTVGPVGQPDVAVVLMAIPGPPVFDEDTAAKLTEVMAKGAAGGLFFETDDCHGTYEELKAKGVEFTQEPMERPTASTPASATRRGTRSGSSSRLVGTRPGVGLQPRRCGRRTRPGGQAGPPSRNIRSRRPVCSVSNGAR